MAWIVDRCRDRVRVRVRVKVRVRVRVRLGHVTPHCAKSSLRSQAERVMALRNEAET